MRSSVKLSADAEEKRSCSTLRQIDAAIPDHDGITRKGRVVQSSFRSLAVLLTTCGLSDQDFNAALATLAGLYGRVIAKVEPPESRLF